MTSSIRGPIGLDVGGRAIKAVQLSGLGSVKRPRLEAAARIERSTSATEDEPTSAPSNSGETDALSPITPAEVRRLQNTLARQGFTGLRVVTAVPRASLLTSVLELPPRDSAAPLAQIARSELAHAHRVEPQTLEAVYWELPAPARAGQGMHAMAAGCAHDRAGALLDALEAGGMEVAALDMGGWALERASRAWLDEASTLVAAVDIGWDAATLALLHQHTVVYERRLGAAGVSKLAASIKKRCGFDALTVEYLLRDVGFESDLRGRRDDWRLLIKAHGPLESWCDALVQELQLAVSYAGHQYPSAPLSRVLLSGGGAGMPGLAAHLDPEVEVDVTVVDPLALIECPPALREPAPCPSLMMASGLALHDAKEAIRCAA